MKPQRRGRRSPVRIVLVTLIVVAALVVAWRGAVLGALELHFGSGFDKKRFDRLESEFDRSPAAFTQADARMRELVAAHPQAPRVSWTRALVCVGDVCEHATAKDKAIYEALPDVDLIVYQSKDSGRTFFRLFMQDPPRYTIMHAPGDTDPAAWAENRGFRSIRSLTPGWVILGPIPDVDRENDQWP
ncbi:hypothetical protein ACTOB_004649 [Actinoplanes oblitus]|uniref:Uncharacterized protein n=1 Tax=Actinoplanes oblitus TaxID=3040509 RepID=A0ABY8W4D6_9ACTN|nr:hypothetical protein [Actinoplanes oblitus]WIM92696.1 hypothetical protein ACTOB_004649 [Actinoplanes oblitus]